MEEIFRFLLLHCNETVEEAFKSEREYTNEAFKSEREHTTTKISLLVTSPETKFRALTDAIVQVADKNDSEKQAVDDPTLSFHERITTLEEKLITCDDNVKTAVDILEEAIADVSLKTLTQNSYQEQLLYNLKLGLHDTLLLMSKDKCCPCDYEFHNNSSPQNHSQSIVPNNEDFSSRIHHY